MRALIDADILRFEVGFAAETGWKSVTEGEEDVPQFDYAAGMLDMRIANIMAVTKSDERTLYLTEGRTFRYDIAKRKPYKGTRKTTRPFHFDNLTVYMRDVLGATIVTGIEADDALAIEHLSNPDTTIICSRDKDLRQIAGNLYSWELGSQASFGPERITKEGFLSLNDNKKKLSGTGTAFFLAQVLMGDPTDNIPGLPNYGPVGTYEVLKGKTSEEQLAAVVRAYQEEYGETWEEELTEQGQLCWMTRSLDANGSPVLWTMGMTT